MAPDRAAAWACTCRWSGGGGDRDGRSTSRRWTTTGCRAMQTWSAACEVGCRHHPSPGLGDTSPAVPRSTSGLPSGSQVRSSGPRREQSSSSSDDNGLQRRDCRPARGAARPGGGSPPTSWRSWPVPVPQSPRPGLRCHDGEGGGGHRAGAAAAGGPRGRRGARYRPGRRRRPDGATVKRDRGMRPQGSGPWRLNEPGSVARHPRPVVAAAALGNVFISRGGLHPWDDPISTRGMRPGGTWPPQRGDHTLSGPLCSSRWDDALGRQPGQTWGGWHASGYLP